MGKVNISYPKVYHKGSFPDVKETILLKHAFHSVTADAAIQ